MRHEQVKLTESFDILDVAEIWPRAEIMPGAPLAEIEAGLLPAAPPAVPDMPPAIGRAIVAVYATLILMFAVTMGRSSEAAFMIAISALYLAVFLTVPRVLLGVENDRSRRPDMARFMAEGIGTYTGRLSGAAALAQIFVVPVLLTFAILAIGLAARWMI
jgi:hypothetical protein